jgi:hypothetical protein
MIIVVRFQDGVDRIQEVPEWVQTARKITTYKPGFDLRGECIPIVECEFKGHLVGKAPVFEELTREE